MQRRHVSDEELMAEVQQGQRAELGILLSRYANPLLTFIHRSIGDRHRAEELFQDVFLVVWTQRHTFQLSRRFRSWLYGIAVNKCRAELRRSGQMAAILPEKVAKLLESPSPTPAAMAIDCETARHVTQAVSRLPENQRTAVILRIWNGLAYAEIAQATGLAESTVRSHMFHALKALRIYLETRMKS